MNLWELKMHPWDRVTSRFYPPGQHPAMARSRAYLGRLERHGLGDHEAGQYLRQQMADFEGRESELKALYDRMLRTSR